MLLTAGSFLIAGGQLLIQWLLACKKRAGWLVALAAQVPGSAYDIVTHQYGFLLITVWCLPVYIKGWRTWEKDAGE